MKLVLERHWQQYVTQRQYSLPWKHRIKETSNGVLSWRELVTEAFVNGAAGIAGEQFMA